jgi:L-rhamnose mutarotase
MKRRFCLALDLKDDPQRTAESKRYHEIGPEVTRSIKDSGREDMKLHRRATRRFMIMGGNESFSFEA